MNDVYRYLGGASAGVDFKGLGDYMPHHGAVPPTVEHGAEFHTDVTRELFIPVYNDVNGGATLALKGAYSVIELADGAAGNIYVSIKCPDDFVSFTSLKMVWMTDAVAGNMRWRTTAYYGAAGEVFNLTTETPAQGVTANGGAGIINVQEPANPLGLAGFALGDYIGFKTTRDGVHADDTINDLVRIIGLLFTYTAEQ